ncbi:MAG: sulfotransferase family protein [Acidimicrobiia bacterium]
MGLAARVQRLVGNAVARRHPAPIFVLGNQKSGTSAIALLLGQLTGLATANDLRREIGEQLIDGVRAGTLPLSTLIRRNRLDFSRPIIKHPNLTLVYHELRSAYPAARYVFLVRDPLDNIRSIFDRLGLPGTTVTLEEADLAALPLAWRSIVKGASLGLAESGGPCAVLAQRWNLMVDVYLNAHREMVAVRYEDFVADKMGCIRGLASSLGLDQRFDISASIDRQYQPRGVNRGIDPESFFGEANSALIREICRQRMPHFKYT